MHSCWAMSPPEPAKQSNGGPRGCRRSIAPSPPAINGDHIAKAGQPGSYDLPPIQTARPSHHSKTHTFGDPLHSKTHTFSAVLATKQSQSCVSWNRKRVCLGMDLAAGRGAVGFGRDSGTWHLNAQPPLPVENPLLNPTECLSVWGTRGIFKKTCIALIR